MIQISNFRLLWHHDCHFQSSHEGNWKISISFQHHPPVSSTKISKISKSAHSSGPWITPRHPGNHYQQQISLSFQLPPPSNSTKSASASSSHHQAAAPNQHQLPASTTRQQHQISISFQFPPPGSSTKSASTSELYQLLRTDLVFVIDDWTLHKQLINMFIA